MISTILFVFAFVLFLLEAFRVPSWPVPHLGWLGLAFCALAVILGGIGVK